MNQKIIRLIGANQSQEMDELINKTAANYLLVTKVLVVVQFLIVAIVFSSCVPNRKLVYLQNNDEIKQKKELIKDSVIREHPLEISEYRIQPLDILYVRFESLTSDEYDFFSKTDPNSGSGGGNAGPAFLAMNGVLVDSEGNLEYPVVGKINVAGLTVFQAQDKIQKIANQFMRDVVVRVRLLNFRYTLLGEVQNEQTVTSYNTRLTMMEAVGLAGGFSELADRENVKVIRQNGSKAEVFYVDLLNEKYVESPLYYVQQNDVIIVSPLKQRPFRKYFAENLNILTSTVTTIIIVLTLLSIK